MRIFLFFISYVLFTSSLHAQDLSQYEKKTFVSSRGDTLPYRILYPLNYDPAKKYPLFLFLHGAGERGTNNEAQLMHGASLFLADSNRTRYPAIVVFPQCPQNSFWARANVNRTTTPFEISFDYSGAPSGPLNAAIELTRQLMQDGSVDKKRVYVTGLSMGGMGTFEAVFREPKLFAAAVPICGGGNTQAYNRKTARVPFRVFHGAADAVVNVKLSQEMVARLKELNAKVEYVEYPGVNHNSWDNAFAEPDFISWFYQRKK